MPLYVYRCPAGHETEALVKHDGSNAPTTCTHRIMVHVPAHGEDFLLECGGAPLERVIALNAKSFPGADSWRK